ncbi:Flp family type IVb pilin [Aeromicrobium chenweiae]|uniref:Flp family type IVb pilin n=1 Tax=Aeromicrobium chenweiae TaxID=2079793 RepID=A0A2S0WJ64_9ACTN|nr:Flp family type IVb pilin [Aeromicrobium chenweiae]AWB91379.1 Flp family type IVb pilin [Aeromicrobium chenweiae]TGN30690.1 Flp family type IVb pilin [Aeromicrobium chenweiae]
MSKFSYALAFISATMFQAKDRREEKGATAVEYGLLVALIAGVIIAVVALLGKDINTQFTKITDQL